MPRAKRTAQDRLNVILGIMSVNLFAAMVIAAVSKVLEPAPSTWQALLRGSLAEATTPEAAEGNPDDILPRRVDQSLKGQTLTSAA